MAIALMVVYHFCFDLTYFHVLSIDFNHDPLWLGFRALILSMFLGLVGVSLCIADSRGPLGAAYLRRLGVLVACATMVSAASFVMFPRSMIFFGVLHSIAVASVLARPLLRLYWVNLVLGLGVIVAGLTLSAPVFDHPALQWLGMMTHKPVTEDYVPLIPWFGVVVIGLFLGRTLLRAPFAAALNWRSPAPPVRLLAFCGRHSLLIYMVHQPVFFVVLYFLLG